MRTYGKHIALWVGMLLGLQGYAQTVTTSTTSQAPTSPTPPEEGLAVVDSAQSTDTTQSNDTLSLATEPKRKPSAITAPIDYVANDSIVLMGNGIAYLHGESDVKYEQMELTSEYIRVHMDSSQVFAQGVLDSVEGEWIGRPVFKDGKDSYESDQITYNLKTQKGFIRKVVTEQGEGYVIADKTKKTEGNTMMMGGGMYTTCDQHDHPHFYLKMTKAKVVPGEYIATGPAYMVVGDVPVPLAIPFGFFPFTNQYSS